MPKGYPHRVVASLEALIPTALSKSRSAFISEFVGFHLLKPPTVNQTEINRFETLHADETKGFPPSHIVPSRNTWQATLIAKQPDSPYPERISIGRATKCDVVLRFPVVSKMHGYFCINPEGRMELFDLGSSNGTWHNGRRIEGSEGVVVSARDLLSFGGVHCEVLDAAGLYDLVSGAEL